LSPANQTGGAPAITWARLYVGLSRTARHFSPSPFEFPNRRTLANRAVLLCCRHRRPRAPPSSPRRRHTVASERRIEQAPATVAAERRIEQAPATVAAEEEEGVAHAPAIVSPPSVRIRQDLLHLPLPLLLPLSLPRFPLCHIGIGCSCYCHIQKPCPNFSSCMQ
jgi:hypothetical protein